MSGSASELSQTSVKIEIEVEELTYIQKHRANVNTILENSNATPIHGQKDSGYVCCLCSDSYLEPSHLKQHNLEMHTTNITFETLQTIVPSDLSKLCIKLDITDLICTLCHANVDSLEALMEHLESTHEKQIYTDITHQILPFKFDTQHPQCHICDSVFNKFKRLMEHMNVHYRNFNCDECDSGFVSRRKLYTHKLAHNTGSYPCAKCSKIFTTFSKKRAHERKFHDRALVLNKCGFCNAMFKDNRLKDKHLETEHGVGSCSRTCGICGKVFGHQHELKHHIKRNHTATRPHKCDECGKAFFSTSDLKAHKVKHTGKKDFQCDVCSKAYARKWNLHEHMRIHLGDSRFRCERCGQAFVQKCNLSVHMRTKHGEELQSDS